MGYVVRLTEAERTRLARLLGSSLAVVIDHGWDVTIQTDRGVAVFVPQEVATADTVHPHGDVVRPSLTPEQNHEEEREGRVIARDLGVVNAIFVLTTEVAFSLPRQVGPTRLLNVNLPAGLEYGPMFRRPSSVKDEDRPETGGVPS